MYLISSEITTSIPPTIDEHQRLIPDDEQDEDRWRYASRPLPGRDPVAKRELKAEIEL